LGHQPVHAGQRNHRPLLCQRGRYEAPFVRWVADELASRCALIPWLADALGMSDLRASRTLI
jgi:hypothetical protein